MPEFYFGETIKGFSTMSEKKYFIEQREVCWICKGRGVRCLSHLPSPLFPPPPIRCNGRDGRGYSSQPVEVEQRNMGLFIVEPPEPKFPLREAALEVVAVFKSQADEKAKCRALDALEQVLRG